VGAGKSSLESSLAMPPGVMAPLAVGLLGVPGVNDILGMLYGGYARGYRPGDSGWRMVRG
jgi:hypothetical protein